MSDIRFELNVPSGVLVYGDSIPGFRIYGTYDINSYEGLIKTTLAMAEIGCAHAYVGNSCPGIYRVDENTLLVANSADYDDEASTPVPGEYLGQVLTDLWWYTFADADEYVRRGGKPEWTQGQIAVRPGVYQFNHRLPERYDDGDMFIYARIVWLREPDPVIDYLAEEHQRDFTAENVILNKMHKWPQLYSGEQAVIRAANSIFCVIGNGGDWHPNGFYIDDPEMRWLPPMLTIPEFDQPYDWYPLSTFSALVKAASGEIYLNESFAKLAKNVARSIAKYGTKHDPESQAIAAHCLEQLLVLYPD